MSDKPSVLFLNLTAFKGMGGIEKFNRAFLKALTELQNDVIFSTRAISMYDHSVDEKYYPSKNYFTGKGQKILTILKSISWATNAEIIILGHINLAVIGKIIKTLYPSKKYG